MTYHKSIPAYLMLAMFATSAADAKHHDHTKILKPKLHSHVMQKAFHGTAVPTAQKKSLPL